MSLSLEDEVQYLKGVGPSLALKLNRIGIFRVLDLLYYFPRAYEDRRKIRSLGEVKPGERATFRVRVIEHSLFFYSGKNHPRIKIADQSGVAYLYCFNRSFLTGILKVGTVFLLTGSYNVKYRIPTFTQFDYELSDNDHTLRILPVYRLTEGVSQKILRKLTWNVLSQFCSTIQEEIPGFIKKGYRFRDRGELIKQIHYPEDMASLRRAREAFSYQEFFKYQLIVAIIRSKNRGIFKKRLPLQGELKKKFLKTLPFKLTDAQKRVVEEIEQDLVQPVPMNRLIQGDVGSGKTLVAVIASLHTIELGGQVAIMAPTEILARQHLGTIRGYLMDMGIRIEFISGGVRGSERKKIVSAMEEGKVDIIIGTHALFSEDINFKNLSLVIIDEQHKFGVLQRGNLRAKGRNPDCIVMSATPIPRTLAMTLYGDLDVSVIDEMPPGRSGIDTHIVRQAGIRKVYEKVKEELKKGRQAYFVYPLIEESSSLDLKNAINAYKYLKKEIFPEFKVGLLHGRMNDQEKDRIMKMFKEKKLDILVTTTVVEVGVDVSNATVMVIEQAERFGLSNIHQLRGRIGRGAHHSFCFLVPDRSTGREAFNRLMILKNTLDGFEIAEWDLKIRGPGEIIGKRQSGVPSFIIDDFNINTKLIYRAQKDARRFIEGEIGSPQENQDFINNFVNTSFYREALMYFGG